MWSLEIPEVDSTTTHHMQKLCQENQTVFITYVDYIFPKPVLSQY